LKTAIRKKSLPKYCTKVGPKSGKIGNVRKYFLQVFCGLRFTVVLSEDRMF